MSGGESSDVYSAEKRSDVMRRIKSQGTGPERRLAAAFRQQKLRFRMNVADLPGSPDFVFTRARLAVFVHGCFWHGHDCARGKRAPKTNADYWAQKIARNKKRDRAAAAALRKAGWSVSTIWECRMKDEAAPARRIARRLARLKRTRKPR